MTDARKRMLALWAMVLLTGAAARAQVTVIGEYRLTDPNALGAVQGPAEPKNRSGDKHSRTRQGDPQYFNVPPKVDDGRSLQFDGKHDAYLLKGGIANPPEFFVLEAWARAATSRRQVRRLFATRTVRVWIES